MPSRADSRSSNKSSPESDPSAPTPPTQPSTQPTASPIAIPSSANTSRKRTLDDVEDEDDAMDLGESTGRSRVDRGGSTGRSPDPVLGSHIAHDPMTGERSEAEGHTTLSASAFTRTLHHGLGPTLAAQAMEAEDGSSVPTTSSSEGDGSPQHKAPRRDGPNDVDTLPGTESLIDDFTRQLGVGWRRVGGNDTQQAGNRGWARYIENNYDLTNVQFVAQNRSNANAFLVETAQGFYLFNEDLVQGRLVTANTTDPSILMARLQGQPILGQPLQLQNIRYEGGRSIFARGNQGANPTHRSGEGSSAQEDIDMEGIDFCSGERS